MRLLNAPMANWSATRKSTSGSAAVPEPVVTAPTTASTSSLEIHTRAAGTPPIATLRIASERVRPGLASQTSARTRRKPLQVVPAFAQTAPGLMDGPPGVGMGAGKVVPLVL